MYIIGTYVRPVCHESVTECVCVWARVRAVYALASLARRRRPVCFQCIFLVMLSNSEIGLFLQRTIKWVRVCVVIARGVRGGNARTDSNLLISAYGNSNDYYCKWHFEVTVSRRCGGVAHDDAHYGHAQQM